MDTLLIPIVKDKKGNLCSKDNYRPIAITSVLSKIFEAIILDRYYDNLHTEHNQFGFKDGHSTDLCIFSLKHVIDYYSSMNSPIYICYLDASKAFDRLNFWTLAEKLLDRQFPPIIVRLLLFWYTSQKFFVKWGSTLSEAFGASNGVRQGGVLSPYLFNVYMDDLSVSLNMSGIGCSINNTPVNHLMYADDTVLIASSAFGLQRLITICENYASQCDIIFNASKSKYMAIIPKHLKIHTPRVKLAGNVLELVTKYKYLGYFISDNNRDDDALSSQIRGLYCRGNALIKHFRSCSEDVKLTLFKTFCNSFYCSQLWSNCSAKSYNRIRVAYNRVFRVLMKLEHRISMSAVFISCRVDHFNVLFRKSIFGFINRLWCSENIIIDTIVKSDYFSHSLLNTFWTNMLYS